MNRLAILTVVVIIVLVGIGALAANSVDNGTGFQPGIGGGPEPSASEAPVEEKASDASLAQSAAMYRIIQDHTLTGSAHLQDLYDGEDTSDTKERLAKNTEDFIKLVRELSNNRSTDQLEQIWREHMTQYEAYTNAVKNGDAMSAAKIKNDLQVHAERFGMVINELLLNTSEEEVTDEMREHINLTLSIIDAHAADDDSEKLAVSAQASVQAGELADALLPDED